MDRKMKYIIKSDIRYSGFILGFICACAGTVLFSIFEIIRMGIQTDFSPILLSLIPPMLIYGCVFSAVPGGIGGFILGVLLRHHMQKGSLTLRKAKITGILLAGVAAAIVCGSGLLFMTLAPHNYWYFIWIEIKQGTFFDDFLAIIYSDLMIAGRFAPEILTTILIACTAGGWTGQVLAKKLLTPVGEAPTSQ